MNSTKLKQLIFFSLSFVPLFANLEKKDTAIFYKKFKKIKVRRLMGSGLIASVFSWCVYSSFFKKNNQPSFTNSAKISFEQKYLELYQEHNSWSYKTKDFLFKVLACPIMFSFFGLAQKNKVGIFSYFYLPFSYKKIVTDQLWILNSSIEGIIDSLDLLISGFDVDNLQVQFASLQCLNKCFVCLDVYDKFEKKNHTKAILNLLSNIKAFFDHYHASLDNYCESKKISDFELKKMKFTLVKLNDFLKAKIQGLEDE